MGEAVLILFANIDFIPGGPKNNFIIHIVMISRSGPVPDLFFVILLGE